MIYIGTSGYSYADWVGRFYPQNTLKNCFFTHYIKYFNCVELNYTYYTIPNAFTLSRLVSQTELSFRFSLKACKEITQDRSRELELYTKYLSALDPIIERRQLGCVLLQFPNSFRLERSNVDHLRFIRDRWPSLPLVVEFRHESWVHDERTWQFLRDNQMSYCCVDEPDLPGLMPSVTQCTAEPAYVRFHGRNSLKWYNHKEAWERYDYLYDLAELRQWVHPVRDLDSQANDVFVFFNNHYEAKAVRNAREFHALFTDDSAVK